MGKEKISRPITIDLKKPPSEKNPSFTVTAGQKVMIGRLSADLKDCQSIEQQNQANGQRTVWLDFGKAINQVSRQHLVLQVVSDKNDGGMVRLSAAKEVINPVVWWVDEDPRSKDSCPKYGVIDGSQTKEIYPDNLTIILPVKGINETNSVTEVVVMRVFSPAPNEINIQVAKSTDFKIIAKYLQAAK